MTGGIGRKMWSKIGQIKNLDYNMHWIKRLLFVNKTKMSGSDKEALQSKAPETSVPDTDELNKRFRKETEGAITEWDEKYQDANTYFIYWINKLQSDRYSEKDCGEFLDSFFSKNPKLDKNSLYQFKYFCDSKKIRKTSFLEEYTDIFSDIPLEDLLMTGRVNETVLDKLNFSYDSKGFDILQKAGCVQKLSDCEKWHDLTKEQVIKLAGFLGRAFDNDFNANKYLGMLSEGEVDEEIIYFLLEFDTTLAVFIQCAKDGEIIGRLDKHMISIKEQLDKYNLDYFKYFKLLFIHNIRKGKIGRDTGLTNLAYLDETLNAIQTYLDKTEIDCFISKDMIETLKKDKDIQLLSENNAVDIMNNYCDQVECDIEFSKFGYDQKFVIGVNPTEKKIKLFSRNEENLRNHANFYYLPEGMGFNIVGGGWIRHGSISVGISEEEHLKENEIYVYGSSEDFGDFQNYGGLVYRIIKEKFPEKEIIFDSGWNSRRFSEREGRSYSSSHH